MRILRIILPLLAIGIALMPVSARAEVITDAIIGGAKIGYQAASSNGGSGDSLTTAVLAFGNNTLLLVREGLVTGVAYLSDIMKSVLALPLTTGDAAVYAIWKIIRDLLNMLFIVLLIFTAFGTIFKTLNNKYLAPFYYSQALPGIVGAALLMNMSLPIGQVVVWAGNWATQKALVLMPNDGFVRTLQNMGIHNNLAKKATTTVRDAALAPLTVPWDQIPKEELTAAQRATLEAWANGGDESAVNTLVNCLRSNTKPIADCYSLAQDVAKPGYQTYFQSLKGVVSEASGNSWKWLTEQTAFGKIFGNAATGYNIATGNVRGEFFRLLETAPSVLFLVMVFFAYLSIIIFFLVRIPFVWFALAISSFAAFSFAIPKGSGIDYSFGKWLYNLVGWCMFGPVYIFFLYIGMFVASKQGDLIASMQTAGGNTPLFAGILASGTFAVMQFVIFMGGAVQAKKIAFGFSAQAGKAFSTIGKYSGIGDDMGLSLMKSAGATALQKTGVTPAAQALTARGKQAYEDTSASIRGTFPRVFRSEAESQATWNRRFGVRGGTAEEESTKTKRISAQRSTLESSLKERLNKETDPARRNQIKEAHEKQLRSLLNSSNRDAAVAAGALLLEQGKLNPGEIKKLGELYRRLSPLAYQNFETTRNTQLIKLAGDKKYGSLEEMAEYMDLIQDSKEAKKFYDAALNGKNKVLAIQAGAARGLITDSRSGKKLNVDEVMATQADKFTPDQLLDAEEFYAKKIGVDKENYTESQFSQIPEEIREKIKKSVKNKNQFGELLQGSSGEQQLRIMDQFAAIKTASSVAKRDIKSLRQKDRKYEQGIKRLRKKQEQESGREKQRSEKWIERLEARRDEMRDQMEKLKKDVS